MTAPRYDVRAGFLAGNWTEIGSKYSWAQINGNFRWEELAAGPVPDIDCEEIQISRKIGTMFDRLTTGECRMQLDNSHAQYTGTKSLENLIAWSDDVSASPYWAATASTVSSRGLVGKTGAIDAFIWQENTTTSVFKILQGQTNQVAINSGQTYTVSGEFFPGTRDRFVFRLQSITSGHIFGRNFSIRSLTLVSSSTGASGQNIAASIYALPDNWVRCTFTGAMPTNFASVLMHFVSSGGAGQYISTNSEWMGVRAFSITTGSTESTYVPTTNSLAVIARATNINANDVLTVKAVSGSSVYNIFSGYVEQWGYNPALRDLRKISVSASDVSNRLRPVISTSLQLTPSYSTMIQEVMSAVALDPLQYRIDNIIETAEFSLIDQLSAGQALSDIQQNAACIYYVDGAGRFNARSRYYDVTSTSAVGSYAAGFGMVVNLGTGDVYNNIEVRTTPRKVFPDVSTVAWLTDPIFVPAASSRQFVLDFVDYITNETGVPVFNVENQIAGIDYRATADPLGQGSDITSQFNVISSLNATSAAFSVANNGAGNGYLVICQLKGKLLSKQPELIAQVTDAASQAKYQDRYLSISANMLATNNRIRNLAEYIIFDGAEPKQNIAFTINNEWPGCFSHDLLSRIFISNNSSYVGSVFVVEELEHTIIFDTGVDHKLQMNCKIAPIKNWFTLDSSTLGRLNYNRLGF